MKRGATPFASVEPGLRHERRAGVVVGEDAVEHLLLVFAEMVEAQAAGDAELVGHRQRAFAEERELIELVAEVGEEQRVLGRAKPLRRNSGQSLKPVTGRFWP